MALTGIYVVFFDFSGHFEDEIKELKFWLWAISQYAVDSKAANDGKALADSKAADASTSTDHMEPPKKPPIIIVGTHWKEKKFEVEPVDSELEHFFAFQQELRGQVLRSEHNWAFRPVI